MASSVLARPAERATRTAFVPLVALLALAGAGKAVLYDSIDPDCFFHLLAAGQMGREGVGPIVDRQSFMSVREPWTPYSWLAEFAMKFVWDHGGYRAAVATHALMSAALISLIALTCATRAAAAAAPGDSQPATLLRATVATAAAAFMSLAYLSFRPVTAALVVMALCAWLLVRDRAAGERSRAVWLVIPLTALLVNLHLYAVIVPAWLAALWAGSLWEAWRAAQTGARPGARRRSSRYALLMVGCGAACLATPMLRGFVRALVGYQFHDAMVAGVAIAEFQPFYTGPAGKVSGLLVLLMVACAAVRRRELRAGEVFWLLGSIALLMRMGRFAPVFAIVAGPIFAATLPRLSDRLLARPFTRLAVVVVLAIGIVRVAAAFPGADVPLDAWMNRHGPDAPGYPAGAAAYVEHHVAPRTGRLINEFTWGAYLAWRLGPRYQVLLDGRTNVYTPDFWRAGYLAPPAERAAFLAAVDADAAVLPAHGSRFLDALKSQGWTTCYSDDRSVVLVPSGSSAPGTAGGSEAGTALGSVAGRD